MTGFAVAADTALLRGAEHLLNFRLQSLPASDESLTELSGKLIGLELEPALLQLFFSFKSGAVQVLGEPPREPDVWVRGTVVNLIKASGVSVKSGVKLQLDGDVEVGQTFQRLLSQSEFDWEEWLSLWLGDVATYCIGAGLRRVRSGVSRTSDSVEVSIGEYLIEESRVLVQAGEVRRFIEQVDDLRNDINRLEARLSKMTVDAAR